MNIKQVIRTDIAVSAVAHLSLLAGVFVFSEVHPFRSVTETIAVDIVAPEQVPETKPEPPAPPPKPENTFDFSVKPDVSGKPDSKNSTPPSWTPGAAAQQAPVSQSSSAPQTAAAAPPQKQALSPALPDRQLAMAPPPAPAQPRPQPPPSPVYAQPEPDISVKYHVLLGLPQDRPGDGFDAPATDAAEVGSDAIAEFRRHLRTCSKLPESVTASDKVSIKLRVLMTPDGMLSAEPQLIEASASLKGPALMQSAIAALQACQPYAMLPQDKYNEWKVLDLNFTPRDFSG